MKEHLYNPTMPSSLIRWLAVSMVCLTLASCFEPPVLETLRIRFLPNGAAVVTRTVVITEPRQGDNPALARRLAQTRQELLEGRTDWSPRFAALDPAAERFGWEKRLGEVYGGTHVALVADSAKIRDFFADTALDVSYEVRDGIAELVIVPRAPSRATWRQRKEMERTLEEWTGRVAEYLAASEELYAYVEDRPDRARSCFGTLFADLLAETDQKTLETLTRPEAERVDRVREAMEQVWDVLLVPQGADYSPDEVSHLVYDPFPAPLTVRLPSVPLEAPEGFETEGEALTAAGPGLWRSLRSLEGRWLAPDPLLLYVARGGQTQEEPLDLEGFLSQPRQASPAPSAAEVRQAIEERLRPAPLYRVTWRVQSLDDDEAMKDFDWEGEGERWPGSN